MKSNLVVTHHHQNVNVSSFHVMIIRCCCYCMIMCLWIIGVNVVSFNEAWVIQPTKTAKIPTTHFTQLLHNNKLLFTGKFDDNNNNKNSNNHRLTLRRTTTRPTNLKFSLSQQQQQQQPESTTTPSFQIRTVTGNVQSIQSVASFLLDSFWLGTDRQQTNPSMGLSQSDSNVRTRLLDELITDLTDKYGKRVGRSLRKNCILTAVEENSSSNNNNNIIGLVSFQELLLDHTNRVMLTADESDTILREAVSKLGPKQRKQYQKSSAQEIASNLLMGMEAIVCFTNLSVGVPYRRNGIGKMLCQELEQRISDESFSGGTYDTIYLKVETDNTPATIMYETLGYKSVYEFPTDTAIRLDNDMGEFVEIQTPTMIMKKSI